MNHGVEFSKESIEELFADPEVIENCEETPSEERKITFNSFRRIMVDFIYRKKDIKPPKIQARYSTP
jgi:uncharacterized DUF497 family protein